MKQTTKNRKTLTIILILLVLVLIKCTSGAKENDLIYDSKKNVSDSIVEYNKIDGEILENLSIKTDYFKINEKKKTFETKSVTGWIENDTIYLSIKDSYRGLYSTSTSKQQSSEETVQVSVNDKEIVNYNEDVELENNTYSFSNDDITISSEMIIKMVK